MRTNCHDMLRKETNDEILIFYLYGKIYCEIRICFVKLYNSEINHLNNIEENIIIKMDELLTNTFEGKKYYYEIAVENSEKIVSELNDYLLERKVERRPCSFHICFIIEKPSKFIFDYKVLNVGYLPLMGSHSNDSLSAKLILFILNN